MTIYITRFWSIPAPFNLALENKMYGGQIGLDWLLTDPRNALELRVIGKAGWYYNDYSLLYRDFFGPVASSSDGTSFVGDLNFSAAYWFNNHIALRAGYQLLWMGDVAVPVTKRLVRLLIGLC